PVGLKLRSHYGLLGIDDRLNVPASPRSWNQTLQRADSSRCAASAASSVVRLLPLCRWEQAWHMLRMVAEPVDWLAGELTGDVAWGVGCAVHVFRNLSALREPCFASHSDLMSTARSWGCTAAASGPW